MYLLQDKTREYYTILDFKNSAWLINKNGTSWFSSIAEAVEVALKYGVSYVDIPQAIHIKNFTTVEEYINAAALRTNYVEFKIIHEISSFETFMESYPEYFI